MDPEQHNKTGDVEHLSSLIRICGLNVCGLTSKINNGILNEYIKQFDIFSVFETKLAKGTEIENFTVFDLDRKPSNYRLPGIHGLSVYVSDKLAGLCTQISEPEFECDNVLWIKVNNYFILGSVYMSVEKTNYNKKQYTELSLDIFSIKADYNLPIVLIGDFNGRTGVLNDVLLMETNDNLDIENYDHPDILNTFNSLNIPIHRTNMDTKKSNNNGNQIIEMCKLTEICILNGRFGTDKNIGIFTFDNKSTIDYAMCSPNLFANITDFSIDTFDRLLSDKHSPINLTINVDITNVDKQMPNNTNVNIDSPIVNKVKWIDSKSEDYKKSV